MTDISEALDEQTIDRDPINQFKRWFDDAIASGMKLPEAMTLATATRDGRPSARVVLLKDVDNEGFVFFTNYRSAKARDLEANPQAALVFYWSQFDRQVRVEGTVERVSAEESRTYFKTRPRESQIGAWASIQSQPIERVNDLMDRVADFEAQFNGVEVPRPPNWSGFRLRHERIEFWKAKPGRLHERHLYTRSGESWTMETLYP